MQAAYRWYRVSLKDRPIDPRILRDHIGTFTGQDWWFSPALDDGASVRFFRRTELNVEQYDSSGQQFYRKIESVSSMDIAVLGSEDGTVLRLANPGRNARSLLMALEHVMGFGFSSAPVLPSPASLVRLTKTVNESKLVGLKINNVFVSPTCVGRMEFASREGIELEDIEMLRGLRYDRDYAKYELLHKGIRGQVAVFSSGVVRVGGALASFILNALEAAILVSSSES